jgi:hypothetical protein
MHNCTAIDEIAGCGISGFAGKEIIGILKNQAPRRDSLIRKIKRIDAKILRNLLTINMK